MVNRNVNVLLDGTSFTYFIFDELEGSFSNTCIIFTVFTA